MFILQLMGWQLLTSKHITQISVEPKKNICVFTVTCQENLGSVVGINIFFFNYRQNRCIRLDGPAARCSGRPKLPRQFVPVRNFEPRLFVPMPGNMGRPAFTFINLYIFCNLQRIINKNIHLGYVCIYFLFRNSFVCLLKSRMLVNGLIK
jgi:hypothetical protein